MILGDLLDARVLDRDGTALGHVVDVRLALELRDDPGAEEPDEAAPITHHVRHPVAVGGAAVVGLLVSPRRGSSFLGYERTSVTSPAMVAALMRRRHRGAFLVDWRDVSRIDDGSVTLAEGFARLDPSLG